MTLGDILSSSVGVPIVGKVVEFHVSRLEDGVRKSFKAKALLVVASVLEQEQISAETEAYLRKRPEWSEKKTGPLSVKPPIPDEVFQAERQYKFLTFVLRDHEHPIRRFVENDQYEQFKQAIIPQQIGWLSREYFALVEQEYPEIMTKEDVEDLQTEAEGK